MPLGTLLVRDGLITAEQLESALAEKEETGRRLGEIVVAHGWVAAGDARAAPRRAARARVRRPHDSASTRSGALLPEKFARRYEALPVRFLADELVLVAVADPTNVVASDDLRLALGLNVRLAVAAAPDVSSRDRPLPTATSSTVADDRRRGERRPRRRPRPPPSAPAINLVNSLIAQAIDEGASDLHFEPQATQMVVRAASTASCASLATVPKDDAAGRDEPAEDHGRARHRRAARAAGRPHVRPLRRPADGPPLAVLPTTHGEQIVLRIMNRPRRPPRARRARHEPRRRGGVRARDPPAVRRGARRRPDRLRQDDDALRRARPAERRRSAC